MCYQYPLIALFFDSVNQYKKYTILLFFHITTVCICTSISTSGQNTTIVNYTVEDGLVQNDITQLLFDKKGFLWIGTNGGLNVFDGRRFRKIEAENMRPRIYFLIKDQQGSATIIDNNSNLFRTDLNRNEIIAAGKIEQSTAWFFKKTTNIKKVDSLRKHIFLMQQHLGYKNIVKLDYGNTLFLFNYLPIPSDGEYKDYFLVGSKMVGVTKNNRLVLFSPDGKTKKLNHKMPKGMVDKGLIFQSDQSTFCLFNEAIYELQVISDSITAEMVLQKVALEKRRNSLIVGQHDIKTGNFYFGSSKNGLFKVIPQDFTVLKQANKSYDNSIDIYKAGYYSQAEISDGQILINNYLSLDTKGVAKFTDVQAPYPRAFNYRDKSGKLWYSDADKIIIKNGKNEEQILIEGNLDHICTIAEHTDRGTYLANRSKIFLLQNKKVVKTITKESLGLAEIEDINYLSTNRKTDKLTVLTNKGVYEYDPATQKTLKIPNLIEGDYRIMQEIKDGYYFVGTYGVGYYIYKEGQWTRMPEDKNGYLKFAHAALCDKQGHVWISTNNGLFRTRMKEMVDYVETANSNIFYYYYDKSHGFLTDEFNGGCQSPAIKLSNGKFSYSTIDGLVQFDPLNVPAAFPLGELQIDNLWLNSIRQDSIPSALTVSQNVSIKLEVDIPFYGHANNFTLQYRVLGSVNEWQDLTENRFIVLQNLGFGTHNLEIRNRQGFGEDSFVYRIFKITVLPHYYQTWWFWLLTSFAIIALLISYIKWRTIHLNNENTALEKLVEEKNIDLISINKSLAEKVKTNEMFHAMMVHDLKTPLTLVQRISQLLKTHLSLISKEEAHEQLDSIEKTTGQINLTINQFLTLIKEKNNTDIQLNEQIIIIDLFTKIKNGFLYNPKLKNNKVRIDIDCKASDSIYSNYALLTIILHNLLDNSLKYTDSGQITLYFLETKKNFTIGCRDTGKGIPADLIEQIVSKNTIEDDKNTLIKHMGYFFINDVLQLLPGRIEINSNLSRGTDVNIIFTKI